MPLFWDMYFAIGNWIDILSHFFVKLTGGVISFFGGGNIS